MSKRRKKNTVEKRSANRNGVRRFVFVWISFILEILLIVGVTFFFSYRAEWFDLLLRLAVTFLVLGIFSQYKTSAMKMPWIVLIMGFPAMGVSLYLMNGLSGTTRVMRRRLNEIDEELLQFLPRNTDVMRAMEKQDKSVANISHYLRDVAGFPAYADTLTEYHDSGEKAFAALLKAIKGAKKFIFMEYHAFEDAEAFWQVEEALAERAQAGVEVRLLYDDVGSIPFITTDFIDRMRERGINARMFNPVNQVANLFMNNRDHRKITVIDGGVGFTGGYNIANEYFNITHPYGHWKDAGVKLTGRAVKNLTATFLELWIVSAGKDQRGKKEEVEAYITAGDEYRSGIAQIAAARGKDVALADEASRNAAMVFADGFVQPYADTPMYHEPIGENVYISLIERARDYIWLSTPYLIITDEMTHALGLAAKRGVDVRIVTPGIPDKKTVFSVTRSYYHGLARNGVRIFEYAPGFNHSKICVSDDVVATCGTINLDFRSLYHHFEDGCLFYKGKIIEKIKADFLRTFPKCEEVTQTYATGRSRSLRFGQLVLRMVAPLL